MRHGIDPKMVAKWRKRQFAHDAPMWPKDIRSTVLSIETAATVLGRHIVVIVA